MRNNLKEDLIVILMGMGVIGIAETLVWKKEITAIMVGMLLVSILRFLAILKKRKFQVSKNMYIYNYKIKLSRSKKLSKNAIRWIETKLIILILLTITMMTGVNIIIKSFMKPVLNSGPYFTVGMLMCLVGFFGLCETINWKFKPIHWKKR